MFMEIFDIEILHKILNYAFLKIQAYQARKIDAADCMFFVLFTFF